jgi:hypothetical protein
MSAFPTLRVRRRANIEGAAPPNHIPHPLRRAAIAAAAKRKVTRPRYPGDEYSHKSFRCSFDRRAMYYSARPLPEMPEEAPHRCRHGDSLPTRRLFPRNAGTKPLQTISPQSLSCQGEHSEGPSSFTPGLCPHQGRSSPRNEQLQAREQRWKHFIAIAIAMLVSVLASSHLGRFFQTAGAVQ